MKVNRKARIKLFIKLEFQYFIAAFFAGTIGYFAYGSEAGLIFFGLFFVMMQVFLFSEYIKRR